MAIEMDASGSGVGKRENELPGAIQVAIGMDASGSGEGNGENQLPGY